MRQRHVCGTYVRSLTKNSKPPSAKLNSKRNSFRNDSQSASGYRQNQKAKGNETSTPLYEDPIEPVGVRVVARVSTHALREERAYHICRTLTSSADPDGNHIVRPLDMVHLTKEQGNDDLIVCVFEDAGPNHLEKVVDFGPAWHHGRRRREKREDSQAKPFTPDEPVSLQTFLDFAVGASECLEILHQGHQVHGEIRGDAFTMNITTGKVKLCSMGSGLRSFENGLTGTAWSMLSNEIGVKTKLCGSCHTTLMR